VNGDILHLGMAWLSRIANLVSISNGYHLNPISNSTLIMNGDYRRSLGGTRTHSNYCLPVDQET
jgi:hypothetical protein